jgi:hypothetical protein
MLFGVISGTKKITPQATHDLLRRMIAIVWDHRFFFTSVMSLQRLDEDVFRSFLNAERQARVGLAQLVQKAVNDGVVRQLDYPNSATVYAGNIWYVMWSSLFFQIVRDNQLAPSKEHAIENCLMQLAGVMEPMVRRDFIMAFVSDVTEPQKR